MAVVAAAVAEVGTVGILYWLVKKKERVSARYMSVAPKSYSPSYTSLSLPVPHFNLLSLYLKMVTHSLPLFQRVSIRRELQQTICW
jgi:hypothetical protein